MNLRYPVAIIVALTALALPDLQPYADKVGRFESLELVDPGTGKTVQIAISDGSLVVRSAEWGERFEVSIGSNEGRSGVRIGDSAGHQYVQVGFAAEGIGPGIDIVDENARSRGTFNIRSDRGPSLVLYGPEERPRAYLGPQPDGSSRLALFDRSGVPSVTATADDVNKLHGVAVTHYGSDEVGLVISCDKKGNNAMTARTRKGNGRSIVGVSEGKGSGLFLGQQDEANSVVIRGGGDAMGELQFKGEVGAPLGGIFPKEGDDVLSLVLHSKAGVPFVISPPK